MISAQCLSDTLGEGGTEGFRVDARDCDRMIPSGKYPFSCECIDGDRIGMLREDRVGDDGMELKSHDDARETSEETDDMRPGG